MSVLRRELNRMIENRRPVPKWTWVAVEWMEGSQTISYDRDHEGSKICGIAEGKSVEKRPLETGGDGGDGGWKKQEGCMKWETERLELAKYLMCKLGYGSQRSPGR